MKYLPYNEKMIKRGIKIADSKMYQENKIWARYSNDKVDIGEELAKVIRTLNKELSLTKPMRALSVGSSAEPQFRILETAFRGGLYLLDVEKEALDIVNERLRRQYTGH
ncbi:MAG: class I SAM-dependent methyltransferase, partial [Candidatus Omnitrophica bacterium]|nr:class I SAM-dependent methyltransferase [Candidatus Omnitrophota bacterium]